MERGPFWRAGLLPESPWEAHPVTIIANLGEPIGESRLKQKNPVSHTIQPAPAPVSSAHGKRDRAPELIRKACPLKKALLTRISLDGEFT